jgi:hypothetical protein
MGGGGGGVMDEVNYFKITVGIDKIISNVGRNASCKELFKTLNILLVPCVCV